MRKLLLALFAFSSVLTLSAQATDNFGEFKKQIDSLKTNLLVQGEELSKFEQWREKSWFRHLKVSGYTHVQWQLAQSKGADAKFAGGNFNPNSQSRLQLRRARIKVGYKRDYFSTTIAINVSSSGVSLIEANSSFHLPNDIFKLSAGIVYLPFSYHVDYSSSSRLEPEMPRVIRSLIPTDAYLGGTATFKGKKGTELNNLNLVVGVYSNNDMNANLYSRRKVSGRLQYNKKYDNGFQWGVMTSALWGGVMNVGDTSYIYKKGTGYAVNSDAKDKYNKTLLLDVGAKIGFKTLAGSTKLSGEYLWGDQPSGKNSNMSPKNENILSTYGNIYNRQFEGYYVTLEHQFPIKSLFLMARYDVFDPNKKISANQIGIQSGTGEADVKFSTFGAGLAYEFCDKHFRITLYYEHIWNEKCANLKGFSSNILDDILTIRFQAKF